MAWLIGLDEAGYGPNLGPLAQAAVAVRVPAVDDCPWRLLAGRVCRLADAVDGPLIVDDSKAVYAGGAGLGRLERALFAASPVAVGATWADVLRGLHPAEAGEPDVLAECWLDLTEVAPPPTRPLDCDGLAAAALLTPAGRFNRVADAAGSKAAVLHDGLLSLLRCHDGLFADGEPVRYTIDKQGGRHFYAALLSQAFPDGWVRAVRETPTESEYHILNLGRDVTVTFTPKADANHFVVAYASLVAKCLREVCMRQFNRFWIGHVPGLKPTAGYPVDARRFYSAIVPAMGRLGIAPAAVWRDR